MIDATHLKAHRTAASLLRSRIATETDGRLSCFCQKVRCERWGGRSHSTASSCQNGCVGTITRETASMEKVSIIGLDLAKSTIQVHAASINGSVLSRRKISSKKLLAFLSGVDPCIVAMEACAGSHHWGREIGKLGHQVKLIAPIYVKPFVKRVRRMMRPMLKPSARRQ